MSCPGGHHSLDNRPSLSLCRPITFLLVALKRGFLHMLLSVFTVARLCSLALANFKANRAEKESGCKSGGNTLS